MKLEQIYIIINKLMKKILKNLLKRKKLFLQKLSFAVHNIRK